MSEKCVICNKQLETGDVYEHRGSISCLHHFEQMIKTRERQRCEIIEEEKMKTDPLKGLDLSDSLIGKANRTLLKGNIEVASKESERLRRYERGE